MSQRITTQSRRRFDLPFGGANYEDCTTLNKTGVPGPFTRAQFVELLWRVKKIRITANASFTYTGFGSGGTQSATLNMSVELKRLKGSFPFLVDADERTAFKELMAPGLNVYNSNLVGGITSNEAGRADWNSNSGSGQAYGSMQIHPWFRGIQKDNQGKYWLPNKPIDAGSEPQAFYCYTRGAYTQIGVDTASDPILGFLNFDVSNGAPLFDNQQRVNSSINLHGGGVPFPLVVTAGTSLAFSEVNVTSATATIQITEWFAYETQKGAPAWSAATGEPINGGPGA